MRYSYDKAGQRLTQTVTGQPKVSYAYNAAGQVTQISQDPGSSNNHQAQAVSFVYDAAGRRTQTILANGLRIEYGYDAASQLTGITHKKADGSLMGNLSYTYDLNGKRTSASGTLASMELPTAVTDTQFDANNRLTRHNGATYSYDKNGNLTSDGTRSYVWDERNQLKSIAGGAVANFVYDPMGRRITKTVSGTTTGYLYDGRNFVQELAGAGSASPVKANLLTGGIDETFLRSQSGTAATLSHFLPDANNNVIALTDSTQNIATSFKYTPYGETTQTGAANGNTQQYTGRENDGTGLMYYRARYYHLGCNRFISEDPIGWASGQTNNYEYVGGDPVNFVDPSGLDSQYQVGVSGTLFGPLLSGFFPSAGASGGTAAGISTDGTLCGTSAYLSFQANALVGGGIFGGVGVNAGTSVTDGPMQSGYSVSPYVEVNAGLLVATGFSTTFNETGEPTGVSGYGRGVAGVGVGLMAAGGASLTTNVVSPPLGDLLSSVGLGHLCGR